MRVLSLSMHVEHHFVLSPGHCLCYNTFAGFSRRESEETLCWKA